MKRSPGAVRMLWVRALAQLRKELGAMESGTRNASFSPTGSEKTVSNTKLSSSRTSSRRKASAVRAAA
jgi:hypothetical protein